VTWLHASYGIGAMLGPLLMTAIPAGGESLRPHASSVGLVATVGRPRVWLNISLFFVYTGLEVTAGQWAYSLFTEGRGFSPALVGTWIGCYWASLTAGRVVSGAVVSRVSASALLRLATLGAPVAALLVWSGAGPVTSFMGLTGMGFCLAPSIPS
jgi:fucose permease